MKYSRREKHNRSIFGDQSQISGLEETGSALNWTLPDECLCSSHPNVV